MLPIILLALWLVQGLDIEDFGAIPGHFSKATALNNGLAFNEALLAAMSQNDKTVTVRAGREYSMLPAGPIDGAVNIEIVIDGTIHAYEGPETDWPVDSKGGVLSLIHLQNAQNLVIRGSGLVDGHGYKWWWKTILTGKDNRPVLLVVDSSVDVLLEGVTFKNSPKYQIVLFDVLRCTVQDLVIHVDITEEKGFLNWLPTFPLNTDGIDISGRDIYFRNLTIHCFDDAVAVKPMHVNKGVYSNCTENLLIEDSYVKYGVGMSIGSVPPNDELNCIRNVTFNNIKFDYPLKAIYIKPNPGTHGAGLIQQITYQNIEINNAIWWAIYIGTQQQDQPGDGAKTGCSFLYPLPGHHCASDPLVTVDQITLRNVNIHGGLLSPGIINCNSTNPCTNFVFDNVNVYHRSLFPVVEGYLCNNVELTAHNSNLVPRCKVLDS
jgi:polygalacturonase